MTQFSGPFYFSSDTCENAFIAATMVYVDDKRKLHDLNKLIKEAAKSEPAFLHSFPKETERDRYIFDLILRAYIEARYSKHYEVIEEELSEMAVMVKNFHNLVERLCQEKIASFK